MSRLHGRLRRLEQRVEQDGCAGCASRPPLLQMVTPSGRRIPEHDSHEDGPCRVCGEEREVIAIVLAFDPEPMQGLQ